jgi:antitoxin component YwqK of YwqJK toxin-antitoxin module
MATMKSPKKLRRTAVKWKIGFLMALAAAVVIALIFGRQQAPKLVEVLRDDLSMRDGLLHRKNESLPFTGMMIERHSDGTLKSRSSVRRGLLEGVSEGWHTNGVMQVREHFRKGVSHGLRTKWHENGKLMSESTIQEGEHHGVFRRWHENGQLAEEVNLVRGKPDGLSQSYHPSGYLKARVFLKMGEVVEREIWKDGEKQFADAGGSP